MNLTPFLFMDSEGIPCSTVLSRALHSTISRREKTTLDGEFFPKGKINDSASGTLNQWIFRAESFR
jgi:hypothetical protein